MRCSRTLHVWHNNYLVLRLYLFLVQRLSLMSLYELYNVRIYNVIRLKGTKVIVLMNVLACEKCGSTDFFEKNGFRVCSFCRTKYAFDQQKTNSCSSDISLDDDIARLLQKCKTNPKQARRYANRVLDMDPGNRDAMKYL